MRLGDERTMSLEPDGLCLPGDWPRHKLRAYGRMVRTPDGAEYRRLLNFLSKSASQGERALLATTVVPKFAQVPSIFNRRRRAQADRQEAVHKFSHRSGDKTSHANQSPQVNFDPGSFEPQQNFAPQQTQRGSGPQQSFSQQSSELSSSPKSSSQQSSELRQSSSRQSSNLQQSFSPQSFAPQQGVELHHFGPRATSDGQLISTKNLAAFQPFVEQKISLLEEELDDLPFSITFDDALSASLPPVPQVQTVENFDLGAETAVDVGAETAADVPKISDTEYDTAVKSKTAELIAKSPVADNEDAQFISHLELLLNEWFDKEHHEAPEEDDDDSPSDFHAKRREALIRNQKLKREAAQSSQQMTKGNLAVSFGTNQPPQEEQPVRKEAQFRLKNREARRQELTHTIVPLPNGMRREVYNDGAFIIKDAVGRVTEVRGSDGANMSLSFDEKGHFKSFVRSDSRGKIYTTGIKDKHGVVVRDEHGAVRAQGDSMTVDSTGCVSIRKYDGQFWSLDVMRGIHIERRILEDADGGWTSLTALLTSDGFRMVTRFQKLQESKRENYRRYGDWLAGTEGNKFRFYGRDGSMIQFDSDEDLEGLRPSRIWPAGSRHVEREWIGKRQAGTAWEAVHRYIAQYLSAL